MLNKISVKNYKAFKEANLELKPITVLLGANSSGKSSLLQIPLILAQTDQESGNALRVNGALVSLGHPVNVLHKREKKYELEVSLQISPIAATPAELINRLGIELLRNFAAYIKDLKEDEAKFSIDKKCITGIEYITSLRDKTIDSDPVLKKLLASYLAIAKTSKALTKKFNITQSPSLRENIVSATLPKLLGDEDSSTRFKLLNDAASAIEAIAKSLTWPKISQITYNFGFSKSTAQLEITNVSFGDGKSTVLGYRTKNGYRATTSLTSDYIDQNFLNRNKAAFRGQLRFDGLRAHSVLDTSTKTDAKNPFVLLCGGMIENLTKEIPSIFNSSSIKHVSPLRAFPKRYYFSEHFAGNNLNTKDGDSLAEMLKRTPKVSEQVNKWLTKFGMSVAVQEVRDLLQSIRVRQNGMDMDITDVGFGISQILPVIVQGFLGNEKTISLIEQPEIHLHPKMQAELADLFIDMVKSNAGRLVIETHSEYLLKRLRRRIAEGKIAAEDVAIHFVHSASDNQASFSTIEQVSIQKRGSFKWPKDFTEVDLRDTIEFAKLQTTD